MVLKQFKQFTEKEILDLQGTLECEWPNEHLEKWQAKLSCYSISRNSIHSSIKQLLLRGTTLRNTNYVYGVVVYTGHDTKLMQNAKNPQPKMSFIINQMNFILRTVFLMQAILCISLAIADKNDKEVGTFFIRVLTFLVAYSHMIPISLYVAFELLKLVQAYLIAKDKEIYSSEFKKSAAVKTSDLIGELGQNEENSAVYHVNGDKGPYEILMSQNENDERQKEAITKFFTLAAVCHTVVQDSNSQDSKDRKYQASSPDELALVEGARKMGYDFVERTVNTLKLKVFDEEFTEWEILHEFPFDSFRKRMSVIVKPLDLEAYILMTKGADSVMLPRIEADEELKKGINAHLDQFSCNGLRTLVLGQKLISAEQYQDFKILYTTLTEGENNADREQLLQNMYDEMETGLEYVGCTAIEDKLQEGVPETIAILLEAEVRIWVLTGDKQETAIEIGKTCGLLKKGIDICILSSSSAEELDLKLDAAVTRYLLSNGNQIPTAAALKARPPLNLGVVIDGSTLSYVLSGSTEIKNKFFKLGVAANSCICCRVSPKQKADVVTLAKNSGPWLTMAIGDGGNDVSMILEAHVGIGVYGKEGTQATRSADFAIGQFRFLKKLLLFHGRLGYYRTSTFINYFFYKNIAVVSTEIYFAFFNGLSGQIFFPEWLPMLYNAFWTAWPSFFNFGMDRDVDKNYSYLYPKLYKAGTSKSYLNVKTFWKWMIFAVWHGAVCFWIPLMGITVQPNGKVPNNWWLSSLSFCLIMHVVTYRLFLKTKWWNKLNMTMGVLSLIIYYISILILNASLVAEALQPQMNGLVILLFSNFKSWIILLLAPILAIIPDVLLMNISKTYYPNPSDKVQRLQKLDITPFPKTQKSD